MSFEEIQKSLSSKSKLLLKHIDKDEKENTFDKLLDRSDFSEDELNKTLKNLNDAMILVKYYDTYMLILSEEEMNQLDSYVEHNESKSVTHTISFSRLEVLARSNRKFYFKYVLRMRIAEEMSFALIFGSFTHDMIENSFSKNVDDLMNFLTNKSQNLIMEFPEEIQENMSERFHALIPNIIKLRQKYTAIELEKHIVVTIKDYSDDMNMKKILTQLTPAKYRKKGGYTDKIGFNAYIDAWVFDKYNKKIIIDWKSGGHSEQKFKKHAKQIQVYAYLMRLIGEKPDRGVVAYVEHQDEYGEPLEREVDISIPKCETVFNKMFNNYIKKISGGITFDNFKKCCSQTNSVWCEYSRMCDVINDVRLDSNLLKLTIMQRLE